MTRKPKEKVTAPAQPRQHWVWVTGPNYYADEHGHDSSALDPGSDTTDSWWTCHPDTRTGDLVLLYRMKPRQDLAYVLEVGSDARLLEPVRRKGEILEEDIPALRDKAMEKDPSFRAETEEWIEEGDVLSEAWEEWNKRYRPYQRTIDRLAKGGRREDLKSIPPDLAAKEKRLLAEAKELNQRQDAHDKRTDKFFYSLLRLSGLPQSTELIPASEWNGSFVCDYKSRLKLEHPLSLSQLKADPYLSDGWGALRAGFRQRAYAIPPPRSGCISSTSRQGRIPAFPKASPSWKGRGFPRTSCPRRNLKTIS